MTSTIDVCLCTSNVNKGSTSILIMLSKPGKWWRFPGLKCTELLNVDIAQILLAQSINQSF